MTVLDLHPLTLGPFRGFEGIDTLGRWLHFTLGMRGEIAATEDPLGGWIRIELAKVTCGLLGDIAAALAGVDHRMASATVEAAARFFHKNTVGTWFNRGTFHRYSLPLSCY